MDRWTLVIIRERISRAVGPHKRLFVSLVLVVAGLFLVQGIVPPSMGVIFFAIPVSAGALFGSVAKNLKAGFVGGFLIGLAGYTPGTVVYGVATGGPSLERLLGPAGWLLALLVSLVVGLIAGMIMGAFAGGAGALFALLRSTISVRHTS